MDRYSRPSLKKFHRIGRRPPRWSRSAPFAWLFASLFRLSLTLRAELKARRAIAELAVMDDRMLRDIGIGRSEIERAVREPRGGVWLDHQSLRSNVKLKTFPRFAPVERPFNTGAMTAMSDTTDLQPIIRAQSQQLRRSR
jgi:uncharacterized protein YjiS (DUF1127 family)